MNNMNDMEFGFFKIFAIGIIIGCIIGYTTGFSVGYWVF
jgi:hypothetical protein